MGAKRSSSAVVATLGIFLATGTSPLRIVSSLTACGGGCSSDDQCGDGQSCCGGSCCSEQCCGDAETGTCTSLEDDNNCGQCGASCDTSSCILPSHCFETTTTEPSWFEDGGTVTVNFWSCSL